MGLSALLLSPDGSLPALSPPERARELPDIFNVEVCSTFKALHLEC